MISTIRNTNLDAVDLFTECLAQATAVVKQVMPSHYANATPDAESDVREVIDHMLGVLTFLQKATTTGDTGRKVDEIEVDLLDSAIVDLSAQWQDMVDQIDRSMIELDLEETVEFKGEKILLENLIVQLASDLLIHAWDLGEAIGMPVRFNRDVAEAVMETAIVPNIVALPQHPLFVEPISPPSNADIQTRLLALFGRSYAWRSAS